MQLDGIVQWLIKFGATWGVRIVGVILALVMAHLVSRGAQRGLVGALERRKFDLTLTRFFGAMARYVIMGGAIIGCLGVVGFETASFAAAIAAIGLAVGMALQGTLSNFAAGVMLLVFRPFNVGDQIVVSGHHGVVEELSLFTTNLKTLDGRKLVVPNSAVFGHVIENMTHHPIRRADVPVVVAQEADIDETRAVLLKAVEQVPEALQVPPPQIFLEKLGASAIHWQVRVWCKTEKYWDAYQATLRASKMALDSAGVASPYDQLAVRVEERVSAAAG